jgi:hypothetical protein
MLSGACLVKIIALQEKDIGSSRMEAAFSHLARLARSSACSLPTRRYKNLLRSDKKPQRQQQQQPRGGAGESHPGNMPL